MKKFTLQVAQTVPAAQYSPGFLQAMINRMCMSFFKYGLISKNFPSRYDAIVLLKECIREYKKTGNLEYLVDAANYCMIEFMLPKPSKAHWDKSAKSAVESKCKEWGGLF